MISAVSFRIRTLLKTVGGIVWNFTQPPQFKPDHSALTENFTADNTQPQLVNIN